MCQFNTAKKLVYAAATTDEKIFKDSSSGKYYVSYTGPLGTR